MLMIEVKNIKVFFPIKKTIFSRRKKYLKAVNDVSFKIEKNSTLGLVGESGSGKSSIGRAIVGLENVYSGQIFFNNENILYKTIRKKYQKNMQMVFQDPLSSLNPKMKIIDIITETLFYYKKQTDTKENEAIRLLKEVGLSSDALYRYPDEFSGGQCQRISIARAISTRPKFIVCDEAVSALDISIQAQIINLLSDIKEKHNITYLFISHDLSVVNHIADNIAVIQDGKIVEMDTAYNIINRPKENYTKYLINSVPKLF